MRISRDQLIAMKTKLLTKIGLRRPMVGRPLPLSLSFSEKADKHYLPTIQRRKGKGRVKWRLGGEKGPGINQVFLFQAKSVINCVSLA
ncbi:hypothetical protein CCUS01_15634 [Colletotrichum cuscutae]|uniref:Uncharacterized protein n=1 Tax=Colletotrichum cuscutae TaxID=1209917 RepID=A0AAI9VE75_9PEZI|nr:hypothetical protein CCUS01_15634 [Colletotrichum cuscutae]